MSDGTSTEIALMRGDTVYALSVSREGVPSTLSNVLSSASDASQIFSMSRERITGIRSVICRMSYCNAF